MPRNTLASTIQFQVGAQITMKGTGRPASQPTTRIFFRPSRSDKRPANRLLRALTIPKVAMNERIAVFEARPKSSSAMSGRTVRSSPTVAPTKALTNTSSENWGRFSRKPRRIVDIDLSPESDMVHAVSFFHVESTRAIVECKCYESW